MPNPNLCFSTPPFLLILRHPQTSTLFPYTTLFRSHRDGSSTRHSIFARKEESSEERMYAKSLEVICGHDFRENSARLVLIGHRDRHGIGMTGKAPESVRALPNLFEIQVREGLQVAC